MLYNYSYTARFTLVKLCLFVHERGFCYSSCMVIFWFWCEGKFGFKNWLWMVFPLLFPGGGIGLVEFTCQDLEAWVLFLCDIRSSELNVLSSCMAIQSTHFIFLEFQVFILLENLG